MAWLLKEDDYKKQHDPTVVKKHRGSHGGVQTSPKVKLPTSMKSQQCSLCKNPAVTTIQINEKSRNKRRLCREHANDYKRGKFKYSVKFEKASSLSNG